MKPLKHKSLIPIVAQRTGLDDEICSRIVQSYWTYVRAAVSSLEHVRVDVPALGTFSAQPSHVAQRVKYYESFLPSENTPDAPWPEHVPRLYALNETLKREYQERGEFWGWKREQRALKENTKNHTTPHEPDQSLEGPQGDFRRYP